MCCCLFDCERRKPTGRINYITISKCHNTVNVTVRLMAVPTNISSPLPNPIIYYTIISRYSPYCQPYRFLSYHPLWVPIQHNVLMLHLVHKQHVTRFLFGLLLLLVVLTPSLVGLPSRGYHTLKTEEQKKRKKKIEKGGRQVN